MNALSHGTPIKKGIDRRLPSSLGGTTATGTNPPIEKFEYFYHGDHLGSSNFITDDLGAVYQELEYFPYGETWVEDGGSGQMPMYQFTGKELDPETDLYYYGARYYDPVLSRWISADPLDRFNAQSAPTALNLYQYSLLNPVRYVDPTGQAEKDKTGVAAWFPEGAPIVTMGETFGALAAYAYGKISGNEPMAAEAAKGMAESKEANIENILMLATVGEGIKSGELPQVLKNKAQGEAFEQKVFRELGQTQDSVARRITVKTESGVKTQLDMVGKEKATGSIKLTEAKSSSTAPLTKNQTKAFPEIEKSGGTVVGKGKPRAWSIHKNSG